jgi:hypothetical protein
MKEVETEQEKRNLYEEYQRLSASLKYIPI